MTGGILLPTLVEPVNNVFYLLTEDALPSAGQAEAVHGQVVDGHPGQRESAAHPRVPGVRVQREAHEEEADHGEGDCDDQRHLRETGVTAPGQSVSSKTRTVHSRAICGKHTQTLKGLG